MKTELEQQDIEVIAKRVVELLKPVLANNGRNEDKDTIFDVKGLALYLKVSEKFIHKRTHLKQIPYYKVGGKLLFRKKDIDKWLCSYNVLAVGTPERILKVIK